MTIKTLVVIHKISQRTVNAASVNTPQCWKNE